MCSLRLLKMGGGFRVMLDGRLNPLIIERINQTTRYFLLVSCVRRFILILASCRYFCFRFKTVFMRMLLTV